MPSDYEHGCSADGVSADHRGSDDEAVWNGSACLPPDLRAALNRLVRRDADGTGGERAARDERRVGGERAARDEDGLRDEREAGDDRAARADHGGVGESATDDGDGACNEDGAGDRRTARDERGAGDKGAARDEDRAGDRRTARNDHGRLDEDSARDVVAEAFCQGGPLDELPPSPELAALLMAVSAPGPRPAPANESAETPARSDQGPGFARCGDNALLGLIRGWRRIASQAAAAEFAAVAEFTDRRHAEAKSAGEWDSNAISAADVEIGAALTLTSRSTHLLMERATALLELPATAAALAAGRIDLAKALVFITGLAGQDPALACAIEAQLIDRAPIQTTGQLRTALNRALIAADPEAAERRRQAEEKQGRIERAPEPGGTTASLAGRYLPVPATVAAWNNVTAIARQLRRSGASGTLDELRVHVYLALLSGQAASTLAAEASALTSEDNRLAAEGSDRGEEGSGAGESHGTTGTTGTTRAREVTENENPAQDPAGQPAKPGAPRAVSDGTQAPARSPATSTDNIDGTGTGSGSLTGSVNLTVPLTALLALTESPGELGGYGPITAFTARDLAAGALGAPAVRWCVTVTDEAGQPIGHGCATRKRRSRERPGWAFTINVSALAGEDCTHRRQSSHYQPSPLLRHLLHIRNQRCTAPGCRTAAEQCDDDHTQPYDQGGRTCECNLGPLCRYHHRVKQSEGWRLEQPTPGVFVWATPSGRSYTIGRECYAA